ncbi:hypothetical protein [Streptomyces sp. NPDC008150]
MFYDITLTLIPPVNEHPVKAVIYIIVILVLTGRRNWRTELGNSR